MKKITLTLLLFVLVLSPIKALDWKSAQWIWQEEEGPNDTWMNFRKSFNLNSIPDSATLNIAAESKYWLWINGDLVVREGGLKRGPNRTDSWYDEVSIQKFLIKGKNTIAIQVWYWGKRADHYYKSYNPSGKGGLVVSGKIGNQIIQTDATWKVKVHPAYQIARIQSNNMKPESSVAFDARKDIPNWSSAIYDDSGWDNAILKGIPPTAPWGVLHKRDIPQWKDTDLKEYVNQAKLNLPFIANESTNIIAELPYNAMVYAYIKVESPAGKTIVMGSNDNKAQTLVAEYTTKSGVQEFEMPNWINGHQIRYVIPPGVKVILVKYRETQYDAAITGSFVCNDLFYNTLWEKATRTLNVCIRDTYMDCPDRERALWWGDAVLQIGESFYTMDRNIDKLSKKCIYDLIGWQKEDGVLSSPIPYSNKNNELSTQMLSSIGWDGFYKYYFYTGDSSIFKDVYPAAKKYLQLWDMQADGLVVHRKAGWDWVDWGVNIDKRIIENCFYYWACTAAIEMAIKTGNEQDMPYFEERANSIKTNFDKVYWNGEVYRTDMVKTPDERANAMAVIVGLASPDKYKKITNAIESSYQASPYMEKYIMEALFQMGEEQVAFDRMKKRYTPMVNNNKTTLYENFPQGGTMNHAWNAPNLILSQYAAGIAPESPAFASYHVLPQLGALNSIEATVPSIKGAILVKIEKTKNQFQLKLNSPQKTIAIVGIPKKGMAINEIKVNGFLVWKLGKFISRQKGITFNQEDKAYIKFNVKPGEYQFLAY